MLRNENFGRTYLIVLRTENTVLHLIHKSFLNTRTSSQGENSFLIFGLFIVLRNLNVYRVLIRQNMKVKLFTIRKTSAKIHLMWKRNRMTKL